MSFSDIIFYFFSAVLVASALGVITARNPFIRRYCWFSLFYFCGAVVAP
jgi:NADH:ubiquinone oxidoreductase subunit 6 (subunit J)